MSWLDDLISAICYSNGTLVAQRKAYNFSTAFSVTDDPTNNRITIGLSGIGLVTLAGDVTGAGNATVVEKIHGTTVPAAGSGDVGKPLVCTAAGAAVWGDIPGAQTGWQELTPIITINEQVDETNVLYTGSNNGVQQIQITARVRYASDGRCFDFWLKGHVYFDNPETGWLAVLDKIDPVPGVGDPSPIFLVTDYAIVRLQCTGAYGDSGETASWDGDFLIEEQVPAWVFAGGSAGAKTYTFTLGAGIKGSMLFDEAGI